MAFGFEKLSKGIAEGLAIHDGPLDKLKAGVYEKFWVASPRGENANVQHSCTLYYRAPLLMLGDTD
jgi:hypothetical protein